MKTIYTIAVDGNLMMRDKFDKLVKVRRVKSRCNLPSSFPIEVQDIATKEHSWVQKSALRKYKP